MTDEPVDMNAQARERLKASIAREEASRERESKASETEKRLLEEEERLSNRKRGLDALEDSVRIREDRLKALEALESGLLTTVNGVRDVILKAKELRGPPLPPSPSG